MIGEGAIPQPTFQPVQEKVFPEEETVIVRSNIPGRLAKCTIFLSSNKICSYTSSVMTNKSCFIAISEIFYISCKEKTFPVGL